MHVLFVAGWSDPFGDFIKEHAYAVAAHCKVSYVYLEYIKTAKHFPYRINSEHYVKNKVDHFVIKITCPVRRLGIYEHLIKKTLNQLVYKLNTSKKIDLCHINVRTPVTELVTQLSTLKYTPFVITEHSSFYQYGIYKNFEGAALETELKRIRAWFAQPTIKYILPVSNQLAGVLSENYGIPKSKLVKVPDVTAPEFFYLPKAVRGKLNILLVAIWNEPKNPMLFVRALSLLTKEELSQLRIDWVGEGAQLAEVKKFTSGHLSRVEIVFHGLVLDRKVMASFYQQAHFLVHPTDSETLSVVIIESLCCGTPVVSNAIDGVLELIDESNGLISPIRNEKAMAKNLSLMLKNHNKYDNENISKQALAQYAHAPVGKQIFGIYEKTFAEK